MPEFITLFGNQEDKPEEKPEAEETRGFFGRMRDAVTRTRESLFIADQRRCCVDAGGG